MLPKTGLTFLGLNRHNRRETDGHTHIPKNYVCVYECVCIHVFRMEIFSKIKVAKLLACEKNFFF